MSASDADPAPVPWLRHPPAYADAFRLNIKDFLRRYGRKVPLAGLKKASAYLVDVGEGDHAVKLHVYEERLVDGKVTPCDCCRNMGARSLQPFWIAYTP